jgi:hypothetical protein
MAASGTMRGIIAMVVATVAVGAYAPSATAADWRPVGTSCVNTDGSNGCAARAAFGGAWNIAVSPDRKNAYVAAYDASAIQVLDRDPATGALTPKAGPTGCISNDGSGGACTVGRGLGSADAIAISPDGAFVYVGTWSNTIAVFSRNQSTGLLTQLAGTDGCIANTNAIAGCVDARGMSGFISTLLMSPDGNHLYAGTSPIAVFDRNPATGVLTQKAGTAGCVSSPAADGCASANALSFGRQAAITPDGQNLYLPNGGGIVIFDRDPVSGAIAQKAGTAGCITANGSGGLCAAEPRLSGSLLGVVLGPNAAQLYATMSSGIATFARGGGGVLTLQSCITDPAVAGCGTGQNVTNLIYSAVSPDGADVVANHSFTNGGLRAFSRDPGTGNLSPRSSPDGCISSDGTGLVGGATVPGFCRAYAAVGNHGHVTFVDDSSFVAGFYAGSEVATFKRDFYPQCAEQAVGVPHNTLVSVPLACSDANGDGLTLSIAQAPTSGSLGAIDAAQSRVNYSPFGGFSGTDHFSYQATGAGLTGPPAQVTLNVGSPPPPPPPPTPRIKSPVRVTWGVSGKRIFLLRLKITKVPKGGKAELRCGKAKKCPFKRKSSKKRRGGAITLFKEIKASQIAGKKQRAFRAGQRLELRITAPGFIGKVVRYELKKSKIPSGKELCLPLGAKKPRNRC